MTHTAAEQRVVFLQEQVTLKAAAYIINKLDRQTLTFPPILKYTHHALS